MSHGITYCNLCPWTACMQVHMYIYFSRIQCVPFKSISCIISVSYTGFCDEAYLRGDEVEDLPEWRQQELLYFIIPQVISQQVCQCGHSLETENTHRFISTYILERKKVKSAAL